MNVTKCIHRFTADLNVTKCIHRFTADLNVWLPVEGSEVARGLRFLINGALTKMTPTSINPVESQGLLKVEESRGSDMETRLWRKGRECC